MVIEDRSARGRGSAWHGALVLVAVAAFGCGASADSEVEHSGAAADLALESLVNRLPDATVSVTAIDAVAAAGMLGADRGALGRRGELPALFGQDGPDPNGQLGVILVGVISPLISPSETTHEVIDLGRITGVVRASTSEPFGALVVVATTQSGEELAAAYSEAGYEPAGDDVYVLPGEVTPGDASGGFPAVLIADGLLVLATGTDLLDLWATASGPADDVLTLLDAAGDGWATSIHLAPPGAAEDRCSAGAAIVSDGSADELLLLDDGGDRFDREVADQIGFQVGGPTTDGAITRYPVTSGDPTPAALVTGGVLVDSPPLSSC